MIRIHCVLAQVTQRGGQKLRAVLVLDGADGNQSFIHIVSAYIERCDHGLVNTKDGSQIVFDYDAVNCVPSKSREAMNSVGPQRWVERIFFKDLPLLSYRCLLRRSKRVKAFPELVGRLEYHASGGR